MKKSSIKKKSKDLHRQREKVEHSNIQWIKRLITFSIARVEYRTIVKNSTTSNGNSGNYICNQLLNLKIQLKNLNLNEGIQGWA